MNDISVTHLLLSANAFLIGVLWVSFRSWMSTVNKKLDKVSECVTWADLDKELGPIKDRGEKHEGRLVRMETACEQRHGE